MMKRSTEDDIAMRAGFNRIVELYNVSVASALTKAPDAPSVEAVRVELRQFWETHFADGICDTDGDIVRTLMTIRWNAWPRDTANQFLVEAAAGRQSDTLALLNDTRKAESCYLLNHQANTTSQNGEDGVIDKIMEIMGTSNRWCCEFGAWDGLNHSNTNRLVAGRAWNGVLIEGSSKRFSDLEATYAGNTRAHLFNRMIGFDDNADSIDYTLGQTDAPTDLDLMIVDIDGNDWHVWQTMHRYRPRLLVIEFNPTISNDLFFVQARDPEVQRGCSLNALIALGKAKGYELVCATSWNGFFVVAEEFEKFGIADNSIDAMYTPFMDGRIFHGMDSIVQTVNMPSFLWDWKGYGNDWSRCVPERLIVNR